MLPGLTSRCTKPRSCNLASPPTTSRATRALSATERRPSCFKSDRSVRGEYSVSAADSLVRADEPSAIGTVESANVVFDRETGRSRGFGFVEMADEDSANNAIAQFNGQEYDGRNIVVNEARPREDRGGFGGGGGGGRGGRGGGGGGYNGGGGGRGDRW